MRAAELTLRNGYKFFVIVQESSWVATSTHKTQETTTTTGSAYTYGNTTNFTANTVTHGGYTYNVSKPRAENTILCLKEKPASGVAFDAQFVSNEIRRKYNLGGVRSYTASRPVASPSYSPPPVQSKETQTSSPSHNDPDLQEDIPYSAGSSFGITLGAGLPTFTTYGASELEGNRLKEISDAFEVPVSQITGFRWGYRMEAGKKGRWYTLFYSSADSKLQQTVRVDNAGVITSRSEE